MTASPNVRTISINEDTLVEIDEYADRHGMSRSEAIRLITEAYLADRTVKGKPVTKAKRIAIWMTPEQHKAFNAKVRRHKTTASSAIEATLEKHL